MKTMQAEIPDKLYQQAISLVQEGWFRDEKDILQEALRRFIETHSSALMEKYIRDDVEWGLHGDD